MLKYTRFDTGEYRQTKSGKWFVCPFCKKRFSTNPIAPKMIHHETKCTHTIDGKLKHDGSNEKSSTGDKDTLDFPSRRTGRSIKR